MHSGPLIRLALTLAAIGHAMALDLPIPAPKLSPGSPAQAAVEAYRNGWLSTAVDLATPLADKGDADGLYLLGLAKESPQPARLSRGQAMDYSYRRAAAAGHPEAGLRRFLISLGSNLGTERESGRKALDEAAGANNPIARRVWGEAWLRGFASADGKPDPKAATEWWKKAADAGDSPSFSLLGRLYEGRFGFPEVTDYKLAMECYREAIDLGDDESLLLLGELLLEENTPVYNETEGRECLRKAIGKGYVEAYLSLGDHEQNLKKSMDGALGCFKEGADAGNARCMHRVAVLLLANDKSPAEGLQWLRKSAEAGNPEAAAELGRRLSKEDSASAVPFLLQAAREGIPQAQYEVGMLYLDGGIGYKDPVSAVAWLTEAMKSGDAEIQYKLGTLHERGIGCEINYANAGVLYTLACNKGHAAAAGRVAFTASEGLGTRANPVQAHAYATLAVERGDEGSRPLLDRLAASLTATQKEEAAEMFQKLKGGPAGTVGAQSPGK
ncbi:tetratricopeptide repeat protein [Luteolibacter sp. Populi]|uniref:tetratricopeptide repeat protein n=1 Tax=Luteolibacter sp. Populi TaxID=3230487 RepID=UPI0034672461